MEQQRRTPSRAKRADAGTPEAAELDRPWHADEVATTLAALGTTRDGLGETEAAERLARYGANRLPRPPRRGRLARLIAQFHNLLIYVLLAAAGVSALLGRGLDTLVILVVVLVNAVIGYVQEGRAERALEAIRRMIDAQATVVRGGRRRRVAAHEIVPGDTVVIEAGDRVPADLRVMQGTGLKIDESALTGESVATAKDEAAVPVEAELGDRSSMAHSGTLVAAGQGLGVAVATGARTELGRIGTLLGSVETLEMPLIRQIDAFARRLTFVILGVCAIAFVFGTLVRAYAADEAFMVVVGLAVAAVPEGLPAVMTVALAIGVQRMAARHAIVRRLPAVETLGSVSVICSDKTGTLTRNEMTVQSIVTADAEYEVGGVGYAPEGGVRRAGTAVTADDDTVLAELVRTAVLSNDATLARADGAWRVTGDPMEGALLTLALKAGCDPEAIRARHPRAAAIPFEAQHPYMATRHDGDGTDGRVAVKGAPERLLEMCAQELGDAGPRPLDRAGWRARADALAARGLRVLAIAAGRAPGPGAELERGDVETGLTLLGLTGLIDPPREEAITAVAECRAAGIRVLMITGDHAETAREIARQLGLAESPGVLTGREMDALDDAGLEAAVREAHVFARTTPAHKLRLVDALQAQGLIVAMTGDGVNDAPALKRADVGVAMGSGGTEAAKEAAAMVLADDNFASIAAAVREGRTVYDNLLRLIAWMLPTNGGEAATILGAMAFGLVLPITAIQILWVNLVTDGVLGITLAFEPTEPGTMRRPPRSADASILNRELTWQIALVSLLFAAGAFGMFYWADARGLPAEHGRTLVVNTLVAFEVFYLFSVRFLHGTTLTPRRLVGTRAMLAGIGVVVAAQLVLTYVPFMQRIFETRPLEPLETAAIVGAGIALLVVVELEKRLRARIKRRRRPRPRTGAQAGP